MSNNDWAKKAAEKAVKVAFRKAAYSMVSRYELARLAEDINPRISINAIYEAITRLIENHEIGVYEVLQARKRWRVKP